MELENSDMKTKIENFNDKITSVKTDNMELEKIAKEIKADYDVEKRKNNNLNHENRKIKFDLEKASNRNKDMSKDNDRIEKDNA